MFEKLRENINNMIRSDRPESPTELVFLVGSLALVALIIYCTQTVKTIPHFGEFVIFLTACKGVKVWKGKGKEVPSAATAEAGSSQAG